MSTPSSRYRASSVKVGALTLASIALLVIVLIWLRGRGLNGGQTYDVLFRDVDGMREGAAVQMMGIRIGFVDTTTPVTLKGKYYVNVKFSINNDLNMPIPPGSQLSIEQSGIIGEKFLEITPPQLREVTLSTFSQPAKAIEKGIPVKFLYEDGYHNVGKVERVEQYKDNSLIRHRLYYRVTTPGALMPEDPLFELTLDDRNEYFLRILPSQPLIVQAPDKDLQFTIENPLRIKRFLEIQMESATALKTTNDKINQLLSDETIDTLQSTMKNTEVLTARATDVLDNANKLLASTQTDLNRLVGVSEELATNLNEVSQNVNDVIGDPQLKQDLLATIRSLNESSASMKSLLNDPAIKETLTATRNTSKDAEELVKTLKNTAQDKQLQERMDRIVTQMNVSLDKLSTVLSNVDEVTNDKDQTLKGILQDTRESAKNMRELTNKFNGHFTLWKLMF